MDKYHVYEMVGTGTNSQVFKGRRKKSIEYVAIKRMEKSKIDNAMEEIKVIHRINSPNVVKFYDWHETRNYVCLILELCAGGDLRTVIEQDHREPESAVQRFGLDILAGLQHTHASGFMHGNLRPSNILIDEYGTLKLGGYGFSRSIADVDAADAEGGKARFEWKTREHQNHKQCGEFGRAETRAIRDPTYMAPELLSGGEDALSFASDFWSLGCVLFELVTGEPPFRSSQSTSVEERIMREDPPALKQWGYQGVRMSLQFRSLVRWLLQKDPLRRPTWPQLLAHPFWDNCQTPSPLKMPAQPRFDQAVLAARVAAEGTAHQTSPRGIGSSFPRRWMKAKHEEMKHATDSEGEDQWRSLEVRHGEILPSSGSPSSSTADSRSRLHFPSSSSGSGEGSSGAPRGVLATALSVENSGPKSSEAPLSSVIYSVHPPADIVASDSSGGNSDYAKVKARKPANARQRGELLPAEVSAMTDKALIDHLAAVYSDLTEASAHEMKKRRTLLYLQSLAGVPRLATILVNSMFLVELLSLLRKPYPASIRGTVAAVISKLVRHATVISPQAGKMNSYN